jgi:hypothetical protein
MMYNNVKERSRSHRHFYYSRPLIAVHYHFPVYYSALFLPGACCERPRRRPVPTPLYLPPRPRHWEGGAYRTSCSYDERD